MSKTPLPRNTAQMSGTLKPSRKSVPRVSRHKAVACYQPARFGGGKERSQETPPKLFISRSTSAAASDQSFPDKSRYPIGGLRRAAMLRQAQGSTAR
jgi:hypothetical protein